MPFGEKTISPDDEFAAKSELNIDCSHKLDGTDAMPIEVLCGNDKRPIRANAGCAIIASWRCSTAEGGLTRGRRRA
jgi:hypothetical protein